MNEMPFSRRGLAPCTPERTSEEFTKKLLSAPRLRVCEVSVRGKIKCFQQPPGFSSNLIKASELRHISDLGELLERGQAAFLGVDTQGEYCVGLLVPEVEAEGAEWRRLQSIGTQLNDTEVMMVVQSAALAAWHAEETYCSRCGKQLVAEALGWIRHCEGCQNSVYPRTDPAVIIAIHDADDRLLLAHNAAWAETKVSLIAGYVDAAEPPESAVLREVGEEVGITHVELDALKYLDSQPWPFPRSLMLTYHLQLQESGEVADSLIKVDNEEILWANFYSREQLREAILEGKVTMPSPTSVARVYINQWMGNMMPITENLG